MKQLIFVPVLALALAACGNNSPEPSMDSAGLNEPDTMSDDVPDTAEEVVEDEGSLLAPADTPEHLLPAGLLDEWAGAIETQDWKAANDVWDDGRATDVATPETFISSYGEYDDIDVTFDEGQIEGAAGSQYYTSNAVITGHLMSGEAFRIEGPITLRRVNDVPGADAEQLSWSFESSGLKPVMTETEAHVEE